MDERKPYADGVYRFTTGGGQVIWAGKTHYPNLLTLEMDQRDALELIRSLSTQLTTLADGEMVAVPLSGALAEDPDDA